MISKCNLQILTEAAGSEVTEFRQNTESVQIDSLRNSAVVEQAKLNHLGPLVTMSEHNSENYMSTQNDVEVIANKEDYSEFFSISKSEEYVSDD